MRGCFLPGFMLKCLVAILIIGMITPVYAGSISIAGRTSSVSLSGSGVVSASTSVSAGHSVIRDVGVTAEVSTGSDPASFSRSEEGSDSATAGAATFSYDYDSRISGSISGTGSAAASAVAHIEADEDDAGDPDQIWANNFFSTTTSTIAEVPGSRATASASISGTAFTSNDWPEVGTVSSTVSGTVKSSSSARSTTGLTTSGSTSTFGSSASLDTSGESATSSFIISDSYASGDRATADSSAKGYAGAIATGMPGEIGRMSEVCGETESSASSTSGGTANSSSWLLSLSDPSGSMTSVGSNTTLASTLTSSRDTSSGSAKGSAFAFATDPSGETFNQSVSASGTVRMSTSQRGTGDSIALAGISGAALTPGSDLAFRFDVLPAGYIPVMGGGLTGYSGEMVVTSEILNQVDSTGPDGSSYGSYSGTADGTVVAKADRGTDTLYTSGKGKLSQKESISKGGTAFGKSEILAIGTRNVTSGTADAYFGSDVVTFPFVASSAGFSIIDYQFGAAGNSASSSGSAEGYANSIVSNPALTSSGAVDGEGEGSVKVSGNGEGNTAGILGSVHAAGMTDTADSLIENGLFDASLLAGESSASSPGKYTADASGALSGTTAATSGVLDNGVQGYSAGTHLQGEVETEITAKWGTGVTVGGLGSASMVQPVLDPDARFAATGSAGGFASYGDFRAEGPQARVKGSSQITGNGGTGEQLDFHAAGYETFNLSTGSQYSLTKAMSSGESKQGTNEIEVLSFGFTGERTSMDTSGGISQTIGAFGTGIAGSDNAAVTGNSQISKLNLYGGAATASVLPTNTSVTFVGGSASSDLDALKNKVQVLQSLSWGTVDYNPVFPAGEAGGSYRESILAITNQTPNLANGYFEGVAMSNNRQPPLLDLNLTPLFFGEYP